MHEKQTQAQHKGKRLLRKTQISKNLISQQLHENALRPIANGQKREYMMIFSATKSHDSGRFIPLNYSIKPQIK